MTQALEKLEAWIYNERDAVNQERGRIQQLEDDLNILLIKNEEGKVELKKLESVMGILHNLEEYWHHSFEERLAALITRGLHTVFEEDMEFMIESKTQGDLSVLDFKLVQRRPDGSILTTDIMGAKGGGVVSVVGFLLRLIVVIAVRPSLRPIIFVDESFAHLSREYVPNMARLLRQLVDETKVQIVMITHEPAFSDVADVLYSVRQSNGVTTYKNIPVNNSVE